MQFINSMWSVMCLCACMQLVWPDVKPFKISFTFLFRFFFIITLFRLSYIMLNLINKWLLHQSTLSTMAQQNEKKKHESCVRKKTFGKYVQSSSICIAMCHCCLFSIRLIRFWPQNYLQRRMCLPSHNFINNK